MATANIVSIPKIFISLTSVKLASMAKSKQLNILGTKLTSGLIMMVKRAQLKFKSYPQQKKATNPVAFLLSVLCFNGPWFVLVPHSTSVVMQ